MPPPTHPPQPCLFAPGRLTGADRLQALSPLIFSTPRKPEELKDLAPGTNPPFLLFNKELKTDFIKIEEFLEQTLGPPT